MQGYVETEPCEIEEQAFEFTLISRRSKERSGLRYQRRGINEQGNTANFVETEQLLRIVVCYLECAYFFFSCCSESTQTSH